MTIDPNEAAASLSDIASVERRTRETLVYARSSASLILWGLLVGAGYVVSFLVPGLHYKPWIAVTIIGFTGSFIIHRRRSTRDARTGELLLFTELVLLGFGFVFLLLFWPVAPRQMAAFWPTLVMLGFVIAGIWLGRFFMYCGIAVTALTLAGYFWAGPWFLPWMAVVNGGGLIVSGLWMRWGE
jgi:FtsH-binding integral membrane protein